MKRMSRVLSLALAAALCLAAALPASAASIDSKVTAAAGGMSHTLSLKDDGTVWVYYYDQKIDVTDLFEDGVCYVKLVNGDETLYMTIEYENGYSVSSDKYPEPESFN